MTKKSDENLSQLKEDVLNAVLNDQPFQEKSKRLSFADLPFVLSQPVVYLVDKDVKNSINIEKLNKRVQIVTEEFLKQNPEKSGKTIYFQFEITKEDVNNILLKLNAKIYSSSSERKNILSSLEIKFEKFGEGWKMIDDPTFLSA